MFFYIKEWSDGTATLMTKTGAVLWTFHSIEDAQQVCRDWYQVHQEDVDYHTEEVDGGRVSMDLTCATCAVA
jgi:hypothetical protein